MAGTLDAVLFDAFGTLFAPVSAGSPAAHLCRILASDGVSVPAEFAGRAILAEVELYRAKFPHIRDEQELRQLENEASDLVLAELELMQFPRDRMRQHLLDLFKMTAYPDAESALGQLQTARFGTWRSEQLQCPAAHAIGRARSGRLVQRDRQLGRLW